MEPEVKYSKHHGMLAWSGGTLLLKLGQTIDRDHPIVKERPDLFGDTDPGATIKHTSAPVVERGTSAPGEVRVTPGTGPKNRNPVR